MHLPKEKVKRKFNVKKKKKIPKSYKLLLTSDNLKRNGQEEMKSQCLSLFPFNKRILNYKQIMKIFQNNAEEIGFYLKISHFDYCIRAYKIFIS